MKLSQRINKGLASMSRAMMAVERIQKNAGRTLTVKDRLRKLQEDAAYLISDLDKIDAEIVKIQKANDDIQAYLAQAQQVRSYQDLLKIPKGRRA
ncbi:hypothetical protein EBZ80_02030 [bacterium]|nr:hypothetical protein [bacterium]